jgi:branched-chain amino acid transport system substrate-binding protein
MEKKFSFLLWIGLYLAFAAHAYAQAAPNRCRHLVTIGVVLPLSGGPIASGEAVRNSILLASERYDREKCVRFVFEDDQLTPRNTVTAVNKLVEIDKVQGLIVYGTPTSLAVVDLAESRHLPLIALSILGKVVAGKSYVVKHWCTAERLNEAVVAEVKKRGYKSVAVVSTVNDAMLGLRDLFADSGAVEISLNEEFVKDDFDYRTVVTKIRQKKPDAVYVLLYPPQPSIFVKMLREAKYEGQMFGVHNLEDPNEVKASGNAMLGMWLANGDDTAGERYRQAYKQRFGVDTLLGGASGYDAAKLIIEAVSKGLEINSYLHTARDFSGAFGKYNATGRNDFDFQAVVKTIRPEGFIVN